MKKILLAFIMITISLISYADDTNNRFIITIKNQSRVTLLLAGASFGCGPPQKAMLTRADEQTIHCIYNDELYYDFILPEQKIMPGQSSNAIVINYKKSAAFGRLGIQYSRIQLANVGCGLVMDFNNNIIAKASLNPLLDEQHMRCDLTVDGNIVLVVIGG